MNRFLLFVVSCLVSITTLFGQSGTLFDQLSMESSILKMERNYAVYLPPGYDTSTDYYPVLYLLHGFGDDQTGWIQLGDVKPITDKAILEGIATPMIIIMPDASAGRLGYFNSPNGDWRYEDFFFKELIPHVEQRFRIKGSKASRAVAGLSMGGGGSLLYAMRHPELFAASCPLSAELKPLIDLDDFKTSYYGKNYVDLPETVLKDYVAGHNPIVLVKQYPKERFNSVQWYIDCGDDDYLYKGNSLLHIAMRQQEIQHEFRIRDGAHDWQYWKTALPEVLNFVSQTFGK